MPRFLNCLLCMLALSSSAYALDVYVASATNTVFKPSDIVINYLCDGVNDGVQIQAALNDINNAGGGSLFLSDGVFDVKTTLNIYGNTNLVGAGMDSTILRLSNYAPKFAKAGFLRCLTQNHISIKLLTVDGNRLNQFTDSSTNYGRFGVYTEACNYTTIDNIRVKSWYGYGVDPHGIGNTTIPSAFVTVTHNEIHDNGWDGITIDKCIDTIVAYNKVYNNGRHGINVCTGSKGVYVHDNVLTYNGWNYNGKLSGCGITVQNNQNYTTNNVDIFANSISSSYKGAICLDDVSNIDINNNVMKNTSTSMCLRTKYITDINVAQINVGINVCDGTKPLYSETPYSGPIPSFLATIDPRPEYIVVSNTSTMTGDFRCDGVNDEVEIRKAIMWVTFYGGTVTLSDGVFSIANNIELYSNVVLRGQSPDTTVIRLTNNAPKFKYSGFVRGYDIENILVTNLTIDGNRLNQSTDPTMNYGKYGFYCEVCRNVTFINTVTRNCWGYGIDPHGSPGEAWYSEGFFIIDSLVENNGWDGITIDKTKNVIIKNNIVRSNGRHGVNIVTGSKTITIDSNDILGNGFFYYTGSSGCGVMLQNNDFFGTSDITVSMNNIQGSKNSGVCINDVDYTTIFDNMINGTASCMKYTNSDYSVIDSNTCTAGKKITVTGVYDSSTFTIVNQNNVVFA